MLYRYQKATPKNPHPGRVIPRYLKFIPTLFSALGLALVSFVAFPLVSYQFKDVNFFTFLEDHSLVSPVSYESQASDQNQGPIVAKGSVDYTKASSWFPGSVQNELFFTPANQSNGNGTRPSFYTISIPTLGIEDAKVSLDEEDLTKHLVQYPQTALPGQLGAPVIFGHSTLPQFYDPQKYTTIFSTLPKIQPNSDIIIKYDGLEYTYRVLKSFEVKPSELWVLRQDYSARTLKIVTCVPPGTTLRRLIVEAELVKN